MRPFFSLLLLLCILLPASAQDWARARLEKSPRHLEWVDIARPDGRKLKCFVAYPEVKGKAPAVVLIHEIFGLTDWVRSFADQLAEAGYVVIVPDLLSGSAPGGGGTAELGGDDAARKAVGQLPPEQVTADLHAASDYVLKLPASADRLSVAGFCWGGTQAFRFATNRKDLAAAYVFYGSAPEDVATLKRIEAPVYGFYAENDARINQTLPATEAAMKAAEKRFEAKTYAEAGHGFMRAGEAPEASPANAQARRDAWQRLKALLQAR
jgi:carboxymethylenebutenolidase